MFASFEEECRAGPHPSNRDKSSEVIFFEESILAKKNRSALSYKSFTPFLSDTRSVNIEWHRRIFFYIHKHTRTFKHTDTHTHTHTHTHTQEHTFTQTDMYM